MNNRYSIPLIVDPVKEESTLRKYQLQNLLCELLQLNFEYAVRLLNDTAVLRPNTLKQEFKFVTEPYFFIGMVIDNLEKSNRRIRNGIDNRFLDRTESDFFHAIAPATQDLLRQQGINYD